MEVTVRGRHWEVPESVVDYARRKLGRLHHYLPLLEDGSAVLDLTHQKARQPEQRYLARAVAAGGGVHLRAEEHAAKPEVAIDLAADALASQARRQRERLYERNRPKAPKQPANTVSVEDEEDGALDRVARVKRLQLKPMTVEEAVEQIEVLGHSFFLFQDVGAGGFSLLYRRRAGDYGLITAELS